MVCPDPPETGVVLAAVKHPSRRLRRWPAAMLDRSYACHRHRAMECDVQCLGEGQPSRDPGGATVGP